MAFDAYLYIKGGPAGESAADAVTHEYGTKPIELKSYEFGIQMAASPYRSDGGGGTSGRAKFIEFSFEKNIDNTSYFWGKMCASGKTIDEITINLYRAGSQGAEGRPIRFVKVVITDSLVVECSLKSGGGDDLPTESIKLNYGAITMTYWKTNKKTGAQGEQFNPAFSWSQITNATVT